MSRSRVCPATICLTASVLILAACSTPSEEPQSSDYQDLVALFQQWRDFETPPLVDGIPDYSAGSMAAQHRELGAYERRLAGIDTTGWSVPQQVDYHLVQAEMNGLDFDHRVRRPWARNPAFYTMIFAAQSDVPAHEGPVVHGWIDLWTYEYPLSPEAAAELAERVLTIPPLFEQAKQNLVEDARDLWLMGIRGMRGQTQDLDALASRVAGTSAELDQSIASAREATEAFAGWLEEEAPSKFGSSGVGKDNYTWYLQQVHLLPYTWEEEVTLMRRELARAHAALRLEEHRNRRLPPLRRVASAREHDRIFNAAVTEYMAFLENEDIFTVGDYLDQALRERIGEFTPTDGLRSFFSEADYRDPVTMRLHGHHWFDLARMEQEPHASPIRRVPLLYGGLYLHANQWTMEEAVQFASDWTPRGWLPADGDLVWFEQHLYLQQPGYGTSYLIGKYEIEKLMAKRALQLGDQFTLKRFMDELHGAGVIPVSLIRWELTGEMDEILADNN